MSVKTRSSSSLVLVLELTVTYNIMMDRSEACKLTFDQSEACNLTFDRSEGCKLTSSSLTVQLYQMGSALGGGGGGLFFFTFLGAAGSRFSQRPKPMYLGHRE